MKTLKSLLNLSNFIKKSLDEKHKQGDGHNNKEYLKFSIVC